MLVQWIDLVLSSHRLMESAPPSPTQEHLTTKVNQCRQPEECWGTSYLSGSAQPAWFNQPSSHVKACTKASGSTMGTNPHVGRVKCFRYLSAVFKGIPYASPPLGDLRFAAPVPAAPFSGTRVATTFSPGCPQVCHLQHPEFSCTEQVKLAKFSCCHFVTILVERRLLVPQCICSLFCI